MTKPLFGIDFGTTCSAAVSCVASGDQMQITHYHDGSTRPIVSSVAFNLADGQCKIGREAWEMRMELGEKCLYVPSVKAVLGTSWQGKLYDGSALGPGDLVEALFRELTEQVARRMDFTLDEAVVAIPIGFDADKRKQLRSGASKANVHISSFISEPTAAFFAHYAELRAARNVAVVDWGGGTLDVSILEHADGKVRELATVGMPMGGRDIDNTLAAHVHARFCQKRGIRLPFESLDDRTKDMLVMRCEDAKRDLATDDEALITMNKYGTFGSCRISMDYAWFAELVQPFVDEAMRCLQLAITRAKLTPGAIDRVLLTGGSSELRVLVNKMRSVFGERILAPAEKAWNVAEGSARLALLPGAHYANQSVGLTLADGSYFELLAPGEPLENWQRTAAFGLIDSSEEARIVFAGSEDIENDKNKRQILPFPSYNFLFENVMLHAEVDADHVFRVKVCSDHHSEDFARVWEYTGLRSYYQIEEREGVTHG